MKLTVDYPSVAVREGPDKVLELGRALERIGYDEIAAFDHVVMGFPTSDREAPRYPPRMPILEAVVLLAQLAAVTETIGLSTEVLVLPQRQPVLVAKQIATLDILARGRTRLGVGVGWQRSELEALGERFEDRGRRMDEAIGVLRAYWGDERIDLAGPSYPSEAMAMEPKPPQGRDLPIWIGGTSPAALRRVAELGDGWMGIPASDDRILATMATIRELAEQAGRDPAAIGMQMMLQPPPTSEADKAYYADHDQLAARATHLAELGFDWISINATAVFQAGARSVDAMVDQLAAIHGRIRAAVG